jgi:formate dehydrogenase subunit gamma
MEFEVLKLSGAASASPFGRRLAPAAEVQPEAVRDEAAKEEQNGSRILRFRKSERVLHWSIALPFMVCFASGFILMAFFNLHSEGVSRSIFAWLHRIAGACLILFPLMTALRSRRDYRIHLYNIKQAWTWVIDDVKWLALMGAAAVSRRIMLPEQGKFNAAEKLNFMMVMSTYPVFIVTGILLWLPGTQFLSWIIHVAAAFIVAPLMIGHIYMALINRDTRPGLSGMLSGYVDRHWARHHYRRWFRDNFE